MFWHEVKRTVPSFRIVKFLRKRATKLANCFAHSCKTSWKAMLHVSPPTFKPVVQQSVANVAGVNTDFSLDKITAKSGHIQELRHLLQASLTWARKITEQHEQILLQKLGILSTFWNNFTQRGQPDKAIRQVLTWAENAQSHFSTRFGAMLQNKLHVFVAHFSTVQCTLTRYLFIMHDLSLQSS